MWVLTLNYLFKLPPLTSCLAECQDINTSKNKTKREEDQDAGARRPELAAPAFPQCHRREPPPQHLHRPAEASPGPGGQETC